jgi:2-C-methyl-D-erythritol 2,4-cyclodiphosphate synthase
MTTTQTGIGIDVHKFTDEGKLILGGLIIDCEFGILAHSDGDVLTHAIIDSLLGACTLGDIGIYFPSSSPKYKNISSLKLLRTTLCLINKEKWVIKHIDATIIAEKPRLMEYIPKIKDSLIEVLRINSDQINIKATTTDGLGYIGQGLGISCHAIATVERKNEDL